MAALLDVERVQSTALTPQLAEAVRRLCDQAYGTTTAPYFGDIGPGEHLLGIRDGALVAHLMWVTRWLQPAGQRPLRTAYVELVATAPAMQGRGYASALLERLVPLVRDYELAALSPATEGLYARLGWRYWRGPLSVRRDGGLISTPEERVMVRTLPRTPPLDFALPLSVEWRPGEVW